MREQQENQKEESNFEEIRHEVREKFATLITGGFGVVAALAWNDAIKNIFITVFGDHQDNILAQLLYAVTVTVIVVIASFWLRRILHSKKNLS
ncbi:MAG: hypothetical protein HYZ08_02865 [Candidatus Kerfeldbacteria bacterium]|nr:hypothetical protein [Candidatus Kerfeldbacteria bacterium]